ncbi:hypothetical protein RFI_32327 [Reticulomyxa filosa]|uniref:Uncharacterized protein n=1 Tax=Reticulomyxa filosa TaxID=46433 RepID=X6LUL0_RETFI|nr:hypothetical protein RFI_32327 [Reticulomyxa filosa]|eukprot:ETO05071.1 hypothetical protein RFI_32327 [Reticulomyxa filosa]
MKNTEAYQYEQKKIVSTPNANKIEDDNSVPSLLVDLDHTIGFSAHSVSPLHFLQRSTNNSKFLNMSSLASNLPDSEQKEDKNDQENPEIVLAKFGNPHEQISLQNHRGQISVCALSPGVMCIIYFFVYKKKIKKKI